MDLISSDISDFFCFTFGTHQFILRPVDDETKKITEQMASIMTLSHGKQGREIFIVTQKTSDFFGVIYPVNSPIICILPIGEGDEMKFLQLFRCARTIAFHLLPYGGFLIHGALIEKDGKGIILAAPSETGKSTASKRIPHPWHVISDDFTLIRREDNGKYSAYPWPTWSTFYNDGPGGTWDTQTGVPLHGLFILRQSQEDYTESIPLADSVAWLMEWTQVTTFFYSPCYPSDRTEFSTLMLQSVEGLARTIPVHILHISLTGKFWEKIDFVLDLPLVPKTSEKTGEKTTVQHQTGTVQIQEKIETLFNAGHVLIQCIDSGMNPTLQIPDILDVIPYENQQPDVGDIIYYKPSEEKNTSISRIIKISSDGFQIQGDNNTISEKFFVTEDKIFGRVVGAIRKNEYRKINSGLLGQFTRYRVLVQKSMTIGISKTLCRLKPILTSLRYLHLIPDNWKFRFILFPSPNCVIIKIFLGSYIVGDFCSIRGYWKIQFPFKLFINELNLPIICNPINSYC